MSKRTHVNGTDPHDSGTNPYRIDFKRPLAEQHPQAIGVRRDIAVRVSKRRPNGECYRCQQEGPKCRRSMSHGSPSHITFGGRPLGNNVPPSESSTSATQRQSGGQLILIGGSCSSEEHPPELQ